jgi:ribonuclease-3
MSGINKLKKLFKNKSLLTQALTHKSWVNEHRGKRESNERFEFLGDAVLEFIVSKELYKQFPDKEEGYLTALRANLVNTKNLANTAKKLKVGEALYLSKGEEEGGGRKNTSLLADTTEAVIGALFLDQGLEITYEFVKENVLSKIPEKLSKPLKDAKSRLQELVQAKGFSTPRYKVIQEFGPDHAKKFIVEVVVNGKAICQGEGKSKNEAAQSAASIALQKNLVK